MIRIILLATTFLALGGCSVFGGKQDYAGLTNIHLLYDTDGEKSMLKRVDFVDGKESQKKQWAVQLPDKTIIKFSTEGELAFKAFETRADVQKFVMEKFGELIPGVVESILKAKGISP